jgi:hypothetical protein
MTRSKAISSLISMFCEKNDQTEAPLWLVELYHRSSDHDLCLMLINWSKSYPQGWNRFGYYPMGV